MPLYEYQCDACGNRFEKIQRFSDPPADVCPACGGSVRKLLSSPAIQFKGSGWYITDYAKKTASDTTSASTAKESADKGQTAAKSDSKDTSAAPASTPDKTS
jgi:putative FmdB family regulatory protein